MAKEAVKRSEADIPEISSNKRTKFVELAEKRMANALKAIRLIGNLGNKSSYQYDASDVKKIMSALQDAIGTIEARLTHTESKATTFKL